MVGCHGISTSMSLSRRVSMTRIPTMGWTMDDQTTLIQYNLTMATHRADLSEAPWTGWHKRKAGGFTGQWPNSLLISCNSRLYHSVYCKILWPMNCKSLSTSVSVKGRQTRWAPLPLQRPNIRRFLSLKKQGAPKIDAWTAIFPILNLPIWVVG